MFQQLNQNLIKFVHDGSYIAPSFKIQVTLDFTTSSPIDGFIIFNGQHYAIIEKTH